MLSIMSERRKLLSGALLSGNGSCKTCDCSRTPCWKLRRSLRVCLGLSRSRTYSHFFHESKLLGFIQDPSSSLRHGARGLHVVGKPSVLVGFDVQGQLHALSKGLHVLQHHWGDSRRDQGRLWNTMGYVPKIYFFHFVVIYGYGSR